MTIVWIGIGLIALFISLLIYSCLSISSKCSRMEEKEDYPIILWVGNGVEIDEYNQDDGTII